LVRPAAALLATGEVNVKPLLKDWLAARRLRKFHRDCDRLRIPADVRVRLLKISDRAPDWYAGRQDPA